MSESRLELEQELLLTKTKAQMINKYIDELEENEILKKQWLKSTQELERYKNIIDELETYLQRKYCEYVDMESDDAFVISLILDTLRELKGE